MLGHRCENLLYVSYQLLFIHGSIYSFPDPGVDLLLVPTSFVTYSISKCMCSGCYTLQDNLH